MPPAKPDHRRWRASRTQSVRRATAVRQPWSWCDRPISGRPRSPLPANSFDLFGHLRASGASSSTLHPSSQPSVPLAAPPPSLPCHPIWRHEGGRNLLADRPGGRSRQLRGGGHGLLLVSHAADRVAGATCRQPPAAHQEQQVSVFGAACVIAIWMRSEGMLLPAAAGILASGVPPVDRSAMRRLTPRRQAATADPLTLCAAN